MSRFGLPRFGFPAMIGPLPRRSFSFRTVSVSLPSPFRGSLCLASMSFLSLLALRSGPREHTAENVGYAGSRGDAGHTRPAAARPTHLRHRPLQLPLRLLHAEGGLRARLPVPRAA